jgi:hypothetical protein
MAGMDGPVERAYLVSVEDIRDTCSDLGDHAHPAMSTVGVHWPPLAELQAKQAI